MPSLIPFASAFPSLGSVPAEALQGAKARRKRPWFRAATFLAGVAVVGMGLLLHRMISESNHRSEEDQRGDPPKLRGVVPRTVIAPSMKADDLGKPVHWRKDAVDVVLDASLEDIAPTAPAAFARALNAWRTSGAELPSVSTVAGKQRKVGYDPAGPNENVVLFAKYGWAPAHGALAVTVLTYDATSGAILDADIVINGGGRFFADLSVEESTGTGAETWIEPPDTGKSATTETGESDEATGNNQDDGCGEHSSTSSSSTTGTGTTGTGTTSTTSSGTTKLIGGRFDLQNILTHELGHFFGLGEDHENAPSTMYGSSRPGETIKRTIELDDGATLSALYHGALDAADADAGANLAPGCGRSQIAPGVSWRGRTLFALGALVLTVLRRRIRRSVAGDKGPTP